ASTERAHGFGHAGEAGVPIRILLGEHGDLFWPQTPHLHKVAHHSIRLLGVTRPIIEDVAVGWISPEQAGAGERPEKQRPALESEWQRNYGSGGAVVANEAEHLLFLVKLLHGFCGPRRLIAIVCCDYPQLTTM